MAFVLKVPPYLMAGPRMHFPPTGTGAVLVFASTLPLSCHLSKSMGAWYRLLHCSGDWGLGSSWHSPSLIFTKAESPVSSGEAEADK